MKLSTMKEQSGEGRDRRAKHGSPAGGWRPGAQKHGTDWPPPLAQGI